jgi:cysteine-rich CWC protein
MVSDNTDAIDPQKCPLCGQPNYCEVNDRSGCWCRSETFSEALLSSVPVERSGKVCICQCCVSKSPSSGNDPC